jgi:hypothetical protein
MSMRIATAEWADPALVEETYAYRDGTIWLGRSASENQVPVGYLDDRRYAEGFASARLANEKLGRTRVIQDLRQRRVAPSLAERTVHKVYKDVDEEALIEDFIRRKYRLAPREGLFREDKDLAAAYRRLLRAGFRSGEIIRVLKRFARNPDLLDTFEPPEEEEV